MQMTNFTRGKNTNNSQALTVSITIRPSPYTPLDQNAVSPRNPKLATLLPFVRLVRLVIIFRCRVNGRGHAVNLITPNFIIFIVYDVC